MTTKLNSIEVRVEHATTTSVISLLHQIQHALHHLIATNEATCIDLGNLPLSPQEKEQLVNFLGRGEVEARLNVLGESIMQETQYSGVWLVEHYNPKAELTNRYLEISWLPSILSSPLEDVHTAFEKLTCYLEDVNNLNLKINP
ncbi:MAG: hydrogenase expression/formation C-terminal domain-containing protein [Thiotrichaceae bacterium]